MREATEPLVVSPLNTLPRIDRLWAYLSQDGKGNEGMCAATMPDGTLTPLIAADPVRLKCFTPIAEQLATLTGLTIVLVEFTARTELREIRGASS
jgi:hypothetical protein